MTDDRFDADVAATADFIRNLARQPDEPTTLEAAVRLVVEIVPGCTDAGITLVERRGVVSGAVSSELVRRGDELQYELDEGPCLDTLRVAHSLVSNDLTVERRWPTWTRAVTSELGVRSMMSVLLYADAESHSLGALNLYSRKPDAYDSEDLVLAETLAAHLAVRVQAERDSHHQQAALVNRTVIGQAEGILMERFDISAEAAFAFLRRVSQDGNRKLSLVAHEIVTTRQVPLADPQANGADREPQPS